MTKQELMENYTMEQLADMVVYLQKDNLVEILKLKNREDTEDVQKVIEAMRLTITELCNTIEGLKKERAKMLWEHCDCVSKEEYEKLKEEFEQKERTINQIDDILENLFGVRHDVKKPSEFEQILKEKIYGNITIADFLPEEPIKVADALINASYVRNKGELEKKIHKAFGNNSDTVEENVYSISELRQIAEHLLVYCNANGEDSNYDK